MAKAWDIEPSIFAGMIEEDVGLKIRYIAMQILTAIDILLLRLIPDVSEITTWCRYSIPILVYLITWIRTVRLLFSVGSGLFRKLQITGLFISRITFLMQRLLKTVIHNKRQLACMPTLFMVFYRLTNEVY
ncbi:hypothetical protein MWK63_11980 [Escherichia coli]|nr:hypothetical protein [Escherichia coli]